MYGTAKVCNGNVGQSMQGPMYAQAKVCKGQSMQGPEYARAKECRDKRMQGPKYVEAKVCEGLIIQGPKLPSMQTEMQVYKQPQNDPKENVSFQRAGALLLVGWSRWILKHKH